MAQRPIDTGNLRPDIPNEGDHFVTRVEDPIFDDDAATKGYVDSRIGPTGFDRLVPLPVNAAGVDRMADLSLVLRTGGTLNQPGAYTGGGTGNKAIAGVRGFNQLPMGALSRLQALWRNIVGPGAGTVLRPYMNVLVDFSPDPAGLRIAVMLDDALVPAISAAIGVYGAGPLFDFVWDATLPPNAGGSCLLVNIPGPNGPGGVPPSVTVAGAPFWLVNAFSWAALVAANPQAKLVDAWPNDGGMPAGAIAPAINVVSGDSGNTTKSGKQVVDLKINGASVL